jgi:hypothetical protein
MTKYEVVPATFQHAVELANTMSEADKRELEGVGVGSPLQALLQSVAASRDATSGLADGRVVCMFGIATDTPLSFLGVPWMLGAEELPNHSLRFLRLNRAYIRYAQEEFNALANFVDARNTRSIRWLQWLGFQLDDEAPFGPHGLPFHRFHWEASHV